MTTAPDSLRVWPRQQISQTLTKRGTESPFLIWCDPQRVWRELLQRPGASGVQGFSRSLARVLDGSRGIRWEERMSGATNNEVGAPETRIVVPLELVLTPRGNRLKPGTWTRGHRS